MKLRMEFLYFPFDLNLAKEKGYNEGLATSILGNTSMVLSAFSASRFSPGTGPKQDPGTRVDRPKVLKDRVSTT